MRQDSEHTANNLHWHDGSTCHGARTLKECIDEAIANGWVGKVLKKEDKYRNGRTMYCYSLISSSFDHWAKQGTFVAVVELTYRVLDKSEI